MKHLLAVVLLVLGGLVVGDTPPAAAQQTPDTLRRDSDDRTSDEPRDRPQRPARLDVEFTSLAIGSHFDRIQFEYELDVEQWERLQEHDIQLWFDLYVPRPGDSARPGFTITRRLEAREGTVEFPRWVDLPDDRRVEMCLLGTTPGDNVAYARGYFCDAWVELEVPRGRTSAVDQTSFELTYHAGRLPYPSAPWFDPWSEGFDPPIPPDAEIPGE